jgi:hypothetical protein
LREREVALRQPDFDLASDPGGDAPGGERLRPLDNLFRIHIVRVSND